MFEKACCVLRRLLSAGAPRCRAAACVVLAALSTGTAGAQTLPTSWSAVNPNAVSRKLVWADQLPTYFTDFASAQQEYGAAYPLELKVQQSFEPSYEGTIQVARAQGVDGFDVEIEMGVYSVNYIMVPFMTAADKFPGFMVAPMIDFTQAAADPTTRENQLIQAATDYYATAMQHPSAAKQNGSPIIFTFLESDLPLANWLDAQQKLKQAGVNIYWAGDLSVNFDSNNHASTDAQLQQMAQTYLPTMDLAFSFWSIPLPLDPDYPTLNAWNVFSQTVATAGKPFAGGMWPGYYRGYWISAPINYGAYSHPIDATSTYRTMWERHIAAKLPWNTVHTWNDYLEHTNIGPDSEWNYTRADLTAWYAAQFKSQPAPFTDARLYVTAPQALYLNQASMAEALVLNPTTKSVTATLQLYTSNGSAYGGSHSVNVPAQTLGVVTIPMSLSTQPSGQTLYARATLKGGSIATQQVLSAPIHIHGQTMPADYHAKPMFYSIPSYRQLGATVPLSVSAGVATVTLPAGVTPKFVDILHDNNLVQSFHTSQAQYSATVGGPPTIPDFSLVIAITDDNFYMKYHQLDEGVYVARIIDSSDRVGYSAPVFYKP